MSPSGAAALCGAACSIFYRPYVRQYAIATVGALGPATATVLGAVFLGEAIAVATLGGLACIALGLWVAQRGRESKRPG